MCRVVRPITIFRNMRLFAGLEACVKHTRCPSLVNWSLMSRRKKLTQSLFINGLSKRPASNLSNSELFTVKDSCDKRDVNHENEVRGHQEPWTRSIMITFVAEV